MNLLSNKYEVIRELGRGACGQVYLVRHLSLHTLRAIKVISKDSYSDIYRDAILSKNLKFKGIPIIYDIEEYETNIYIVQEYVEGVTLTSFLCNNSTITLQQFCHIGIELCSILEYLHNQGILHLDLKPANVIIDRSDNVLIIDFDNSVINGRNISLCRGTKGFAAPEQYYSKKPTLYWDIYSLGMILNAMADAIAISNADSATIHFIKTLIDRCTHHNSLLRYKSVSVVRDKLTKLLKAKHTLTTQTLIIHVSGTARGCGVTHFCQALTSFLNRNGFSCVCLPYGNHPDYLWQLSKLTALKSNISNNTGVIYDRNIAILPYTSYTLSNISLNSWQVVVADHQFSEAYDADVIVGNQRHLPSYSNLDSNAKNKSLIFNLCSPEIFYAETRSLKGHAYPYRMPCVYDCSDGLPLADRMFSTMLSEMYPEYFTFPKSRKKGGMIRDKILFFKRLLKIGW